MIAVPARPAAPCRSLAGTRVVGPASIGVGPCVTRIMADRGAAPALDRPRAIGKLAERPAPKATTRTLHEAAEVLTDRNVAALDAPA